MYINSINNNDISNYCILFLEMLPINDILKRNTLELLEVGENKVAIELLCDCMYEDKVSINKLLFTQLGILCYYLKIEKSYMDYLFENLEK